MIAVSVPFPPSTNNLFRNAAGKGRVPTERYRVWLQAAGWAVKMARHEPVPGQVAVDIALTRPDRRARDLDNLAKAPLDLLVKHKLIEDDSRIADIRLHWVEGGPECLVSVRPL
jgi:crossover junction endodeoxyribonuclease RusA